MPRSLAFTYTYTYLSGGAFQGEFAAQSVHVRTCNDDNNPSSQGMDGCIYLVFINIFDFQVFFSWFFHGPSC